jgi:hypothetical protein
MICNKLQLICTFVFGFFVFLSCNDDVGYVEVRNETQSEFLNVNWGGSIHLGSISAGEEKGTETESFGANYIYLELSDKFYRSREKIMIDARTSATFIVNDTSNLLYLNGK